MTHALFLKPSLATTGPRLDTPKAVVPTRLFAKTLFKP